MNKLIKFLGIFTLIGYLFAFLMLAGQAVVDVVRTRREEHEFKKGMDEYFKTHPF